MKVLDSCRYYLPGQEKKWLHLATVHESIREFMAFANCLTSQVYIEEITGGHLSVIEDESLLEEINNFLVMNKLLLMDKPLVPDNVWHSLKPTVK